MIQRIRWAIAWPGRAVAEIRREWRFLEFAALGRHVIRGTIPAYEIHGGSTLWHFHARVAESMRRLGLGR